MRRFVTVGFCLVFCLIVGCIPSNKIAKNFDYGKIEGHVYKNDFFNFEITAPEDWHVEGPEKFAELSSEGIKTLDNKDADKLQKIAEVTTANLWICSKYDFNNIPEGEYDPSLFIIAEKLPTNVKSLTVEKYLEISRDQLLKIMADAQFQPVTKETISDKELAVQKNTLPLPNAPGVVIHQESRVCFINNHALLIGMSYMTDEERSELQKILDTVKFN